MPLPPLEHIVYGPVRSRRLGRSLGVNLLPAGMKVCNMNCAYCQYGWTRGAPRDRNQGIRWPAPQAIEAAVATRLALAGGRSELIDRVTVAGHGEPTLHPEFEEIMVRLCSVRDRIAPGIPIAILSNSTTAMYEDVRRGLNRLDECHMKLDAGDPFAFRRINGIRMPIERIVDGLRGLPSVVIQAMFVSDAAGQVDNSTDGAVAEWLTAVERIGPRQVHVYTIDRPPALGPLKPVAARRLREIVERVCAAGISAAAIVNRSRR